MDERFERVLGKRRGAGARNTWLSDEPRIAALPTWTPAPLAAALRGELQGRRLAYVVVDELYAQIAALVLHRWPRVDERGRLRFDEAVWRIGADEGELQAALDQLRQVLGVPAAAAASEEMRHRPLQVGDVFTAQLERVWNVMPDVDMADKALPVTAWLRPPVFDITATAREAAYAQAYATAAGTLSESDLLDIGRELLDDDGRFPREDEGHADDGPPTEPVDE
jgi:hypothetical protein